MIFVAWHHVISDSTTNANFTLKSTVAGEYLFTQKFRLTRRELICWIGTNNRLCSHTRCSAGKWMIPSLCYYHHCWGIKQSTLANDTLLFQRQAKWDWNSPITCPFIYANAARLWCLKRGLSSFASRINPVPANKLPVGMKHQLNS